MVKGKELDKGEKTWRACDWLAGEGTRRLAARGGILWREWRGDGFARLLSLGWRGWAGLFAITDGLRVEATGRCGWGIGLAAEKTNSRMSKDRRLCWLWDFEGRVAGLFLLCKIVHFGGGIAAWGPLVAQFGPGGGGGV